MQQRRRQIGIAALFNIVLFSLLFAFSTPIFNSGDDAYCLYLLAGGFNIAPTELVHFDHVLHPFLTLPIKHLFIVNPFVNWYSWLLLSTHFLACSIILFYIIRKKSIKNGLLIYSLIFLIFECPFLLSPTFTNTSVALTCAALVVLVSTTIETPFFRYRYIVAISLLVFASLFRIHSIIPFAGIALPFLFFPFRLQKAMRATVCIALSAVLIITLNQIHQSYYKKNIQNWEQEEQYRQKLYKFFNYHSLSESSSSQWKTEQEMIKYALTIDTSFLSSGKLSRMYKDLIKERNTSASIFSKESMKWFLINNRILFFTTFFFSYLFVSRKQHMLSSAFSFASLLLGMGLLGSYVKLPAYIIVGGLGLFSTLVYYSSPSENGDRNKLYKIMEVAGISFFVFWALIRVYKTDIENEANHKFFTATVNEINKFPQYLFLVTDNSFPIDYFSVFDAPVKFPLKNIILSGEKFTGVDTLMFRQFNINKVEDIPNAPNILLWGKPVPALSDYFLKTTGEKIALSEPLTIFKHGEVRRIKVLR